MFKNFIFFNSEELDMNKFKKFKINELIRLFVKGGNLW